MKRILTLSILLLSVLQVPAQQRSDRSLVRKGNRLFADSLFIKAEENYLKAVDMNPDLIEGTYNLGNAYVAQQKPNEAIEQYNRVAGTLEARKKELMDNPSSSQADLEKCMKELAGTYHNAGVVYHASEQYDKAVESYKQALRNNPSDDETRYNMILAQRMLKEQQQQNQDQQDQNQDQNQDQQNQQQQQEQQQNEQDMSKENAEQLLQAAMQDEKDVQERVQQQMMQVQPKKQLEKDW